MREIVNSGYTGYVWVNNESVLEIIMLTKDGFSDLEGYDFCVRHNMRFTPLPTPKHPITNP